MKINSEAILQKLIDDGYLHRKQGRVYISSGEYWAVEEDVSITNDPELFLVIQRALFDECANRELTFKVVKNKLLVDKYEDDGDLGTKIIRLHEGDTSRESFALAYQKLVGIEL